MEKENCLNKRMYEISKIAEIIEIILISVGIFLVPILIPLMSSTVFGSSSFIANNSRYIVGVIVNTALIIAAVNVKGWKKIVGLITLPSISAILGGVILNTSSIYTVCMIPAIWIGNFTMVYLFRKLLVEKRLNYVIVSAVSVISKVALIFAGFNLLTATNVIPKASEVAKILSMSMGINQLITATVGSVMAFGIIKLIYSKSK